MRTTPGKTKPVVPVKVKPTPTPSAQPVGRAIDKLKAKQGFDTLKAGPGKDAKNRALTFLTQNIGRQASEAAGNVNSALPRKRK